MSAEQIGILFVCLGNICRSPLARVIFTHHARGRNLHDRFLVDSCGTGGWHAGSGADPRSVRTAAGRGIYLVHTARKLRPASDFEQYHYLLAMDRVNRDDMLALGAPPQRVRLIRSFDPSLTGRDERELEVPDPYHGGDDGFERVYDMLDRACAGLLDRLTGPAGAAADPRSRS